MDDPVHSARAQLPFIDGETPTMRLFALLELIASKDEFVSLQGLVEETGLPKPTLHRMLHQLESAHLLQRERDGRSYGTGARLRRLAQSLLLNDTAHTARRTVLRRLKDEVGESCNITALSGGEVLYLDRVETAEPLRFYLRPGSHVPAHCSASGKLFLSQMSRSQRIRMFGSGPFERYTANTITDHAALEQEIEKARRDAYAIDDEEFLPGLLCIAVLVPAGAGVRSSIGLAVQAPIMRLSAERAISLLPTLRQAARDLADPEDRPTEDSSDGVQALGGEDQVFVDRDRGLRNAARTAHKQSLRKEGSSGARAQREDESRLSA